MVKFGDQTVSLPDSSFNVSALAKTIIWKEMTDEERKVFFDSGDMSGFYPSFCVEMLNVWLQSRTGVRAPHVVGCMFEDGHKEEIDLGKLQEDFVNLLIGMLHRERIFYVRHKERTEK